MKKLLTILLILLLEISLVSCSKKESIDNSDAGTKWLNAEVIGNITKDTNISIKDDFYAAANKEYLVNATIKEGKSYEGGLDKYSDKVKEHLKSLINNTSINNHEEELVSDLYNMAIDWDTRNKYGVEPIKEYIDEIVNISSIEELNNYFLQNNGITYSLTSFMQDYSIKDSNDKVLYISQLNAIHSDNADYKELSSYGQYEENYSRAVSTYLLKRLGYSNEEATSLYETCIELESELAQYNYSKEEETDTNFGTKTIRNELSLEEISSISTNYPIVEIIKSLGLDVCEIYAVYNPRSLKAIGEYYKEDNLEKIKDYLIIHVLLDNVNNLDYEAYDYALSTSNDLKGVVGKEDDETYALNVVQDNVFDALDLLYAKTYCSQEIKEDIELMINTYLEYYEGMLANIDWLSEETRNKAIEKVKAIEGHASYPLKYHDYSGLTLNDLKQDSFLKVIDRINNYKQQIFIESLKGKKDNDYWIEEEKLGASTINAFYLPSSNDIFICNGILEAIGYDVNWSKEEKLATLGFIIGHELSHAFDPSGAKYDKDGNVNLWWQDDELQEFENKAQILSDYLSKIKPNNGSDKYINGENVRNETVADIAGAKISLLIAKDIDNFDYDKFFRTYAFMWARVELTSYQIYLMSVDVHALAYIRTNVVLQQFEEFNKTYDIKKGDGMYLPYENSLSVW